MAGRFSIEATFKATDKMSRVVGQIESRMGRFASGFSSSMKSIDSASDKILGGLASVAKKAAEVGLIVGGAVAAVAGHIIHTGADFEQSITNVGAVMGKTRSQIGDLEKSAMSLGVTTQFSASEVAEAMEFMARKGFDSEEILQGIPGVLNAIAASGEGMAEVATVVGSSIRGFGLEAKDAGYVANLLAFTAEKTGAKITDMGTALAIAAPTAKALGVSIDDTAAAVGLLQKTGIDASTAGSAVATMLAKISHPSKEAAEKMAAMGIKFKDTEGNMLSFRDVLGQFIKAGDKAGGNMDKMSFFAELVGLRGDKAALGLERMAKSGEFDKLLKSLKDTGDYAGKVAAIRLDTTQGSWKLLLSTIEVLETKLFNLGGGALRSVIDSTNKWLSTNQELIVQKIGDYIDKARFAIDIFAAGAKSGFGTVKEAFAPVVWLFGVFAGHMKDSGTWPDKVKAVGQAFGFLTAVGAGFVVFAGSVKVARAAVWGYKAAAKAAAIATWGWNAAVGAYNLVAGGSAAVTATNTVATWGGRLAAKAAAVAQWAYNGALSIGAFATGEFTIAQIGSKVATIALTAWTWLANFAQEAWLATTILATGASVAFKSAMIGSAAATEGMAGATVAAEASMGAFLVTVGAAAAAVGSLYYAYLKFQELASVSGGTQGVLEGIANLGADPTKWRQQFFEGVDRYQDSEARVKAQQDENAGGAPIPQIASPTQAIMNSIQTNNSSAEVTVRPAPGAQAVVTKPPKGNIGVRVAPSGGI